MQKLLIILYKAFSYLNFLIIKWICKWRSRIIFYLNGVTVKSFSTHGVPYVHISLKAKCNIGKNLSLNNGVKYSLSGTNGKCRIDVRGNGFLEIGNNVGMSDVSIICHKCITIHDNVLLGTGVQIRDTDNHALNSTDRRNGNDKLKRIDKPVTIHHDVFVGANSLILKGVTIGENSIIGAGSVVSKNVPPNQIWAGNPAKFIKESY